MAAVSASLIITLVTTYLLLGVLIAIYALRFLSLRRARTAYAPCSLRGIGGILIWTSGGLTLIYAILGTWWWVTSERDTLQHVSDHLDSPLSIRPSVSPSILWSSSNHLDMKLGAETTLSMLYVIITWCVKAVFLVFVREGWSKLRKATKIAWWISVVNVGLCFLVIFVGSFVVVGLEVGKGRIYEAWEFIAREMVFNIGLAHIQSLLLVILTCALSLKNLAIYFPPSIPTRHTVLLFAFACLSIIFTGFRLAVSASAHPRESFLNILTMGELILLVSICLLPSTAIAKSTSLHGNLTIDPLSTPSVFINDHDYHHHKYAHQKRNRKNLTVSTQETRVTASDFGYTMAQGDHGVAVKSAPLFVPEKVQLKPGWDEKVDYGNHGAGYGSTSEEDSSSDEEMGRGRWKGKVSSSRVSGLRSGYEEGRDWRRSAGGGEDVRTPASARMRTPRTPRGFV